MPGEEVRIYNGPKPSKKCSICGESIELGNRYWRGIPGVTRACLACGSRIRAERAYDKARADLEGHRKRAADRQEHRAARRAAIIRGDVIA